MKFLQNLLILVEEFSRSRDTGLNFYTIIYIITNINERGDAVKRNETEDFPMAVKEIERRTIQCQTKAKDSQNHSQSFCR